MKNNDLHEIKNIHWSRLYQLYHCTNNTHTEDAAGNFKGLQVVSFPTGKKHVAYSSIFKGELCLNAKLDRKLQVKIQETKQKTVNYRRVT